MTRSRKSGIQKREKGEEGSVCVRAETLETVRAETGRYQGRRRGRKGRKEPSGKQE